ncbi:hypothetical protein FRC01_007855, partial [Tulasnella sp. 417]
MSLAYRVPGLEDEWYSAGYALFSVTNWSTYLKAAVISGKRHEAFFWLSIGFGNDGRFPPISWLSDTHPVAAVDVFSSPLTNSQRENFNAHAKFVKAIDPVFYSWTNGTTDYDWPLDQSGNTISTDPDSDHTKYCCHPAKCPMSRDALAKLGPQENE